jgi:serine protease Do
MEDNILLDAIERYRYGQMDDQEKVFFEELRKKNPEIDQIAAEHNFFLTELDKMSELKNLKHNLNEVESKLVNEGAISRGEGKTKAKVITAVQLR